MGISVNGLASGLDVDSIVTQLMALEQRPILQQQQKALDYQTKLAAMQSVSAQVSGLRSAVSGLKNPSDWSTISGSSSNPALVDISVDEDAAAGNHTVVVSQLAKEHKIGSQGILNTSTAIASGTGTLAWQVGSSGATYSVNVDATTTLQQLVESINSTSGGGITASIVNDGTQNTPYRMVLTSKTFGTAGAITVSNNNTNLTLTGKSVEAVTVNTNNSTGYTGSPTTAGSYTTGSSNVTYMVRVTSASSTPSLAAYEISTDGGMNWGSSGTNMNSIALGTTGVTLQVPNNGGDVVASGDIFSVDLFAHTMQSATDAVLSVNGLSMVKSSNTITDVIEGVTLNLKAADSTETTTLSISDSYADVTDKVANLVSAYNDISAFIADQFSYDPKNPVHKPLSGDNTLRSLGTQLRSQIGGAIAGLTSSDTYNSIAQVGLKFDADGQLSFNVTEFEDALANDATAVMKLFAGLGTPSNAYVEYIGKGTHTQTGTYGINITTAPEKAIITASAALPGTLAQAENINFNFFRDYKTQQSAPSASFIVNLALGDSSTTVLNKINSAFATNKVQLTASKNSSNRLTISSTDYGADFYVSAVSNVATGLNGTDIGTTPLVDIGVDVVGTIGGIAATGQSNVLTGLKSSSIEGLVLGYSGTATGNIGNIVVSSGLSDRSFKYMTDITDSKGMLKIKEKSIEDTIDDINARIKEMQDRMDKKEERLRAQYAKLETTMAGLQQQSQYVSAQLASMTR